MTSHAESAIVAKIKRLENERKQALKHLHLLDDNIEILATSQDSISKHNTEHFSYRPRLRVFVGKPKTYLLSIFKSDPKSSYTVLELTQEVMLLDSMDGLPQAKHVKAVQAVLYKLQKDAILAKLKDDKGVVRWRWVQPNRQKKRRIDRLFYGLLCAGAT